MSDLVWGGGTNHRQSRVERRGSEEKACMQKESVKQMLGMFSEAKDNIKEWWAIPNTVVTLAKNYA